MSSYHVENEQNRIIDVFSGKAKAYIKNAGNRNVFPTNEALGNLSNLDMELQDDPVNSETVLDELDNIGSPATVTSAGGRYFGFVIGGSLPAAMGANLLAGVWDQNAGLEIASPIASRLESICSKWLNSLLNLPAETEAGFVTGATMANFTALAAARHAMLEKAGWNVEEDGLFGAPPITVIIGEEAHVSLLKALSLLGLGRNRVIRVPCDNQGRMLAESIPEFSENTILCIQAGNVNTGAFDPADKICEMAHKKNAWVHVDGAFGLWAIASSERRYLTRGFEKADSWATDAHKWLNVPYDSGIAFVKDSRSLTASMSQQAAYLIQQGSRNPFIYVPELSRRARGIEIWAALRSLGRKGLEDLINRNCDLAVVFAEKLKSAGFHILNDVVLNQVLVSFGNPELTKSIIKLIQDDGTCWCGGTTWQNQTAMRISISSWKTSREDIDNSANAIIKIAKEFVAHPA
ncbi:MAG TPA: aminotransferase class V-fold PLP-dependent enzyme [Bacteroidales bacterium]|nr:aminotransferase class V-fold PLP-dependent enzyme [Bacteroidales bacterium]